MAGQPRRRRKDDTAIDSIFIHELRCEAHVGVYAWEQLRAQPLELSVEIETVTREAGRSDRLRDTIDYGAVVERIQRELAGRRFKLLEALADHLAGILVHELHAPAVRISVAKINHLRNVRRMGVVIHRTRETALPPGTPQALADAVAG
jgi:dihydroneopterin aldolase